MKPLPRIARLSAAAMLAASGSADAHIVAARLGDFYTGALHPLTDLHDIVLWLALGVFAGSIGAERARWLVPAVPLGLFAGFTMQIAWGIGSLGTLGDAAMMVGVGLLLAAGIRSSAAALAAIALCVALVRGAVNAGGVVPETNLVLFAAGLATAGYVSITLITALVVAFRRYSTARPADWRGIAIRVCGSWIAAVGIMIGGFALKSGAG